MTSSTTTETPVQSVWILTNAPSPYQVELFGAVAARSEIHLDVRFLRDTQYFGPQRRFPHQICRTWLALTKGDELRLHGHPIREAAFGRYDLYILSGIYTSLTFLACAAILHCRGRKWVLWWERPRPSHAPQQRSWPISWLHNIKDSVRRWLLRSTDLVIGIGSAAVREYEALGVSPARLRMLPYCCDVSRFAAESTASRDRVRRELGWPNRLVFLFSGQLIPRKGVDVLLHAFIQLAEAHSDVALLILGEGTERAALEALVPEWLKPHIRLAGYISQSQLPEYFSAADVFAFPSRHDGWAVVLNEACGAGLPIIATNQTGAAHDLVRDGENGFCIEADDVEALKTAMTWCVTHRDRLSEMGRRSRELVQPFSAVQGARTLVEHVLYVCASKK